MHVVYTSIFIGVALEKRHAIILYFFQRADISLEVATIHKSTICCRCAHYKVDDVASSIKPINEDLLDDVQRPGVGYCLKADSFLGTYYLEDTNS